MDFGAAERDEAALVACSAADLPTMSGAAAVADETIARGLPPDLRTRVAARLAEILVSARLLTVPELIVRCRTRLEALAARRRSGLLAGGGSSSEAVVMIVEQDREVEGRVALLDEVDHGLLGDGIGHVPQRVPADPVADPQRGEVVDHR